ncbi:hypothetical protein BKA56DRAFT_612070 [Ilyonectria sp. MPI-CAGE-AT-0026]|nr:hypothetical protein BKA56DRAFT_612070 [Ilyonectria sp. MPI-CAGE-AT-0026]
MSPPLWAPNRLKRAGPIRQGGKPLFPIGKPGSHLQRPHNSVAAGVACVVPARSARIVAWSKGVPKRGPWLAAAGAVPDREMRFEPIPNPVSYLTLTRPAPTVAAAWVFQDNRKTPAPPTVFDATEPQRRSYLNSAPSGLEGDFFPSSTPPQSIDPFPHCLPRPLREYGVSVRSAIWWAWVAANSSRSIVGCERCLANAVAWRPGHLTRRKGADVAAPPPVSCETKPGSSSDKCAHCMGNNKPCSKLAKKHRAVLFALQAAITEHKDSPPADYAANTVYERRAARRVLHRLVHGDKAARARSALAAAAADEARAAAEVAEKSQRIAHVSLCVQFDIANALRGILEHLAGAPSLPGRVGTASLPDDLATDEEEDDDEDEDEE